MNLSMTPLSDAWSTPCREPTKPKTPKPTTVDAYNSSMSYDEYVINVDSFTPFRIDVSIKNPELVTRLKHMSSTQQVELVTSLLLDYFKGVPTVGSNDIEPRVVVDAVVKPEESKLEMILPNSTPNSTQFFVNDPTETNHTEFMKPFGTNECNNTSLLIVLVFAIWMLLDRLMNIV